MADVERFITATGFDEVTVDGADVTIVNGFGLAAIEPDPRTVDRPDAESAYEQADGIFEEMWTTYEVTAEDGGTRVTATTEFALDATVIERRRELTAQFDWLERVVAE
ncbi:SRPBCC family protein [Halorientalis pallida]|uniref:SRPBCC family protein n=2 Tax=Halorientalis pallida TaxID=2479928 RepID=A0A498L242_9EURY|nr:SRPBCC family protein [Halorientalis pallida]